MHCRSLWQFPVTADGRVANTLKDTNINLNGPIHNIIGKQLDVSDAWDCLQNCNTVLFTIIRLLIIDFDENYVCIALLLQGFAARYMLDIEIED